MNVHITPPYENRARMHAILNGEPFEEVDCLSTWGRKWQLIEDVKRMWYTKLMRGHRVWSAEKCTEQ